jgi:hypothetical protein
MMREFANLLKGLVGERGFEPRTSCGQGSCKKSILLVRLALFYVMVHGFGANLALFGPRLDPSSWGDPLSWHSFFGHSFRFPKSVLASPSRRRGLGKGTAFESPSPATL